MKAKDEKLVAMQQELYELKLMAVENLRKDLENRLAEKSLKNWKHKAEASLSLPIFHVLKVYYKQSNK